MALVFCSVVLSDVPFKSKDEFDLQFELSFKQRPQATGNYQVNYSQTRAEHDRLSSTDPLPFLTLNMTILKASADEKRLRVVRDTSTVIMSRKVTVGMKFPIEVGFTDDARDQVKGFHHRVSFYNSDKQEVSRIDIVIDKDGNYFVNNQQRGKI